MSGDVDADLFFFCLLFAAGATVTAAATAGKANNMRKNEKILQY